MFYPEFQFVRILRIMSKRFKNQEQLVHAAHQHLIDQGLNPATLAREQRHELMVPKLALVGVFQTLETFCEAGKTNVMSTVGPLNTRHLLLFLGALKKSLELGERILQEYQAIQNALLTMEQEQNKETENTTDEDLETKLPEKEPEDQLSEEEIKEETENNLEKFRELFDIRKLN